MKKNGMIWAVPLGLFFLAGSLLFGETVMPGEEELPGEVISPEVSPAEVEPLLEPAGPKPPPHGGQSAPPASSAAAPAAAAPAAEQSSQETASPSPAEPSSPAPRTYRDGQIYQRVEELPLTENQPPEGTYLLLGEARRPPELLFRVNRLPPYLPLQVYVDQERGVYQVFAGPLSSGERSFLLSRRDFLWSP